MKKNWIGIVRYAQNSTSLCARLNGMSEKNSLSARKHSSAMKTREIVEWMMSAIVKMMNITHHERILKVTSSNVLVGLRFFIMKVMTEDEMRTAMMAIST